MDTFVASNSSRVSQTQIRLGTVQTLENDLNLLKNEFTTSHQAFRDATSASITAHTEEVSTLRQDFADLQDGFVKSRVLILERDSRLDTIKTQLAKLPQLHQCSLSTTNRLQNCSDGNSVATTLQGHEHDVELTGIEPDCAARRDAQISRSLSLFESHGEHMRMDRAGATNDAVLESADSNNEADQSRIENQTRYATGCYLMSIYVPLTFRCCLVMELPQLPPSLY